MKTKLPNLGCALTLFDLTLGSLKSAAAEAQISFYLKKNPMSLESHYPLWYPLATCC
jgi:hypothetical protein